MPTPSLTEAVRRELLVRSEVTGSTHRFGGVEFRLGRRELGHLHGPEDVEAIVEPFRLSHARAVAARSRTPGGGERMTARHRATVARLEPERRSSR